jgi:hypothetical protein
MIAVSKQLLAFNAQTASFVRLLLQTETGLNAQSLTTKKARESLL